MAVRDCVDVRWRSRLHKEVLGSDQASEVGSAVVAMCAAADGLLAVMLEPSPVNAVLDAVVEQAAVWWWS